MGATRSEGIARGDAELISAAREGDAAAFGLLYERHAGATWAVARQYTNSAADAEDVVAEAFTKVFAILKDGGGPDVAFRAYIFTTARRLGLQRVQAGNRTQPTDDVQVLEAALEPESSTEAPALADFERGVVGRAYSTLPERWQAVLWYTEVESLSPAKIGPLLGLSANGVAALAYRAREGLRQAYLQQHLLEPLDSGCRTVAGKLGAYVRGGLAARETAQVDQHLEGCGECRALLLELGDVNHGMRAVIAPLVLGALGLGALAQPLPVGGGLAAGFAALGLTPATAAGAGSSASAGSTTTSGTATTGTAATGTASASASGVGATAIGGGAAVAGGTAASAAGIGAMLASLPLAVIGIAASVVVVAAVAAAGVLGAFSSEAPPNSASDVAVTSTQEPTVAETSTTVPASPTDPAPRDEPPVAPDPSPTPASYTHLTLPTILRASMCASTARCYFK
ncbi:sigma-70 family RNA polymerase sigma factor [Cellulomonas timonensis]|uniref:sigma-70 family RNA polymerase sigma factor n=1 Tax=Cellulomonas timonensis TaxID=1689271 RepID=UPI0008339D14|nr:sigma-70 family RNA polymerase sigma factor [Cellulomonas timonensis]